MADNVILFLFLFVLVSSKDFQFSLYMLTIQPVMWTRKDAFNFILSEGFVLA